MREDIVWDLPPGEALPHCKAYCDGWVEMTTGGRGAGDDSKGNSNGKAPADLEDAAECCGAEGIGSIDGEGGDGCNTGEATVASIHARIAGDVPRW